MDIYGQFMKILDSVKKLVVYTAALAAEVVQLKTELAVALQSPVATPEEIRLAQEAVVVAQEKAVALQLIVDEDAMEDAEVIAAIAGIVPADPVVEPVV